MATEAQLQQDLTAAMKAREMETVYVLRGLISAIKAIKVERQVPGLEEPEIAQLVRKEISKREEAAKFARQAQRSDTEEANQREIAILERYMPQQLDAAQLEAAIRQIAAEAGTTDIGPIMAQLKARFAGQYDGKLASQIVKTKLSS